MCYWTLNTRIFHIFTPWNMENVMSERFRVCARALVPAFWRFATSCLFFAMAASRQFVDISDDDSVKFSKENEKKIPQRKQNTMLESSENIWIPFKRDERSHKCRSLTNKNLFWNLQVKKVRARRSSNSRCVLFKQSFLYYKHYCFIL